MPKITSYTKDPAYYLDDAILIDGEKGTRRIHPDDVGPERGKMANVIYDTASGAIADIQDGADSMPMKSIIAQITPVQAGSGDPSPENVRPISGWTGVKVTRTRKNLIVAFDDKKSPGSNGSYVAANNYVGVIAPVKAGKTYLFSHAANGAYGNASFYYKRPEINDVSYDASRTDFQSRITAPIDGYIAIRVTRTAYLEDPSYQFELNTEIPVYEPPQIEEVSVSFGDDPGTVYGGTLDVTTGELTVDKAFVSIGNSIYWTDYANRNGFTISIPGMVSGNFNPGLCNIAPVSSGDVTEYGLRLGANNKTIYWLYAKDILGISTPAELNAWFDSHPDIKLQIVVPLATPQVYHLTGAQLSTLLGENHVFADTGDIAVTYPCDTKMYIDKQVAAVIATASE